MAKYVRRMFSVRGCSKLIYRTIALCLIMPTFSSIVMKIYRTFRDSSVSFTLDTSYLNWNTTFPAVTVCEIYNGEKNWDISEGYFGLERDNRIDDFVADIVFFSGKCESCFNCGEVDCPENFDELISIFRTPCQRLITNCSWTGESFECCEEFKPLLTEYGICFSFNSMQTRPFHKLKYFNNRQTGPGFLSFTVSEDVQVHVHPSNDIPYLMSEGVIKETVLWGSSREIILNIVEMINDASVEGFSPDHRKCRFYTEIENIEHYMYNVYSFSTCVVQCVRRAQLEFCECTSHFMSWGGNDTSDHICDLDGLKCLTENNFIFNQLRMDCECLSSCEEPEYNVIYLSGESTDESLQSTVKISMMDLPTQRYIRNAVKTNLDFIISIGGIAGLFFGASLLSVIEAIYLVFNMIKKRIAVWKKRGVTIRFKSNKIDAKIMKKGKSSAAVQKII